MHNELSVADILNAATKLAVADISKANSVHIKRSVMDACEALIDAGLVPIDVAPEVRRCCDINQQHTVDALRTYLDSQ
ncbi:hypothetical protein V5T82_13580 [Magnetovibrio sp. PR-2]|uniref:hypothetical protein n=1 Tax=Magnetovibrio sp. PR-2 TaxID=3120356 RepID=UPI002FCDFA90